MAYLFYGARVGKRPGVYETWQSCKENVLGFPFAEFKGFNNQVAAHEYVNKGKQIKNNFLNKTIKRNEAIAFVDGSYSPHSGKITYGIVFLTKGMEENRFSGTVENKAMRKLKSVAGELGSALRAMKIADALGMKQLTIYHDYIGISNCIKNRETYCKQGFQVYLDVYDDVSTRVNVDFVHVKGHSGNYFHNVADSLAKAAHQIA